MTQKKRYNHPYHVICAGCLSLLISERMRCVCGSMQSFRVDVEMKDVITLLNQKGLKTVSSCASHIEALGSEYTIEHARLAHDWRDLIYVTFVKKYKFKELPVGFQTKTNKAYLFLEHRISTAQDREIHLQLLSDWASSLDSHSLHQTPSSNRNIS